jgi:oligoribonuclease NrnB/cAMP/cGMP phosphodiesterase (DHH superfamily)
MHDALVIYHKDCLDGMAAAWVVTSALNYQIETDENFPIRKVEHLAAFYNDEVPDLTDKEVYIVDFSYSPEKLLAKSKSAKSVTIIDHHDTAIKEWELVTTCHPDWTTNVDLVFSKEHSGAVLCWKYLFPFKEMPKQLLHCQDHDMWTFEMDNTKDFVTGMFSTGVIFEPYKHSSFDLLMHPAEYKEICREGKLISKERAKIIDNVIRRNIFFTDMFGYTSIPVVNICYDLASDANEKLRQLYPDAAFTLTYDDWAVEGYRKFSIRNDKNSVVDVGVLAKSVGGGGRKGTGGFTMPLPLL